jgi:hypothetical protein
MATLDHNTLRKLVSYERTRDGQQVPNTITGNIFEYACWNWVLSGATLGANDLTSNSTIIANVLVMDNMGFPTGIQQTAARVYPGNDAELARMAEVLPAATAAGADFIQDNAPQSEFLKCLGRIMLRANGLQPIDYAPQNVYNVIVRSSNWWNTDHWALRLNPGANTLSFIQTVPDRPLKFSCSTVWDEGLSFVAIGIQELLQNQVTQLSAVPYCKCRAWSNARDRARNLLTFYCEAVLAPGSGQCSNCGAVACQPHLGSYDQTGTFRWGVADSGTYKCQYCRGDMTILT